MAMQLHCLTTTRKEENGNGDGDGDCWQRVVEGVWVVTR